MRGQQGARAIEHSEEQKMITQEMAKLRSLQRPEIHDRIAVTRFPKDQPAAAPRTNRIARSGPVQRRRRTNPTLVLC